MDLNQHLNQENPVRWNKVILNDTEFKVFETFTEGTAYFNRIKVLAYPQYNYFLKNGNGHLYTITENGDLGKPSVFYIENLNKVNQKPIKNHKKLFI